MAETATSLKVNQTKKVTMRNHWPWGIPAQQWWHTSVRQWRLNQERGFCVKCNIWNIIYYNALTHLLDSMSGFNKTSPYSCRVLSTTSLPCKLKVRTTRDLKTLWRELTVSVVGKVMQATELRYHGNSSLHMHDWWKGSFNG